MLRRNRGASTEAPRLLRMEANVTAIHRRRAPRWRIVLGRGPPTGPPGPGDPPPNKPQDKPRTGTRPQLPKPDYPKPGTELPDDPARKEG